jgi:surface polysaccharide O-acyltransferase-like enzyme
MAGRIHSLDSMRIVAMVFVVAIHTNLFRGLGPYGNAANFVMDSFGRFVVPFFFLTSGFFFALKTANRSSTDYLLNRVSKIASLYVFGLLLAAPVFLAGAVAQADGNGPDSAAIAGQELLGFLSPLELFYHGDSVSVILWFLPALAFSLVFVYATSEFGGVRYLLPLSLGFHVVGLLGASYTMFVDVPFEVRDALFFGFFYTSVGYVIAARDWRPSADRSTIYLGLAVLFGAVHVAERYVLGYVVNGYALGQEVYTASYTVGTALFTIAMFVFLLSRPDLGKGTPLPSWGKYAVGIYVVHPAVLYPLERLDGAFHLAGYDVGNTLAWHLALFAGTFLGALALYVAARKLGAVERVRIKLPRVGPLRALGAK